MFSRKKAVIRRLWLISGKLSTSVHEKARLSYSMSKSMDKIPESTGKNSYMSGKKQCDKNTSDAEASATAAINPYRQNQT